MKPILDLLHDLDEMDDHVQVVGDRLRINAPKGVLTPDLRAELKERKTEILACLPESVDVPAIQPASRRGPLPLSFAQQRLWFLDQLDPRNPAYNLPAVLSLRGSLDIAILERCLDQIVRRHKARSCAFSAAPVPTGAQGD